MPTERRHSNEIPLTEKNRLSEVFEHWDVPDIQNEKGIDSLIQELPFKETVPAGRYVGGHKEALRKLNTFLKDHLLNIMKKEMTHKPRAQVFYHPIFISVT